MMEELLAHLDAYEPSYINIGVGRNLSLGNKVVSAHQVGFELQPGDLVVLGVNESRNSLNPSQQNSPNLIRRYLYSLAAVGAKGRIVDAGNIVSTSAPSDTYRALENVMGLFLNKEITVIVLGGTQELTEAIYRGFKQNKKHITLSFVDSHIDLDNDPDDFHSLNYLNRLLREEQESLFDISFIGYQGYFVDSEKIDGLRKSNYELLRLGFVRGNYREVEPTFRNSDIVSFDIGAVRSSDSPGNTFPSPNGLYAEEACQLARYAGTSERTRCFGIFEFNPDKDPTQQSALLTAQLVWHFIEGVTLRRNETSKDQLDNAKKFIVNSGTPGVDLIFYRNEMSDNWWFEIPLSEKRNNFGRQNLIIPCSPSDYTLASKQEIPERWLRFFHKIHQG